MILVEPQLGENIGMCARAPWAISALTRLRIVKPRDGWPNVAAQRAAAGADYILDAAELFDTVEQAVADCTLLFATTARAHDQAKPVVAPEAAAREIVAEIAGGGKVGILFGRERYGLENEEVALANRIITFPVNPGVRLAQPGAGGAADRLRMVQARDRRRAAVRDAGTLRARLAAPDAGVLRQSGRASSTRSNSCARAEKRDTMLVNLRNIFTRMEPTKQDMHTLHGVVMAIAEGRKGPAKGGVLDGDAGDAAARAAGRARPGRRRHATAAPCAGWRGCCGEIPTDAERAAVGGAAHRPPLRRPIQAPDPGRPPHPGFRLVRAADRDRTGQSGRGRASSATAPRGRAWLEARGYRVIEMRGCRCRGAIWQAELARWSASFAGEELD